MAWFEPVRFGLTDGMIGLILPAGFVIKYIEQKKMNFSRVVITMS